MTALTPNPIRPTTDGQRVRVVADAVVSSYVNELARSAQRHEPARSARSVQHDPGARVPATRSARTDARSATIGA
jgi:hypothetical protein